MNINIQNGISQKNKRNKKPIGILGQIIPRAEKNSILQMNEEAELLDIVKKAKNEWLDANSSFEQVIDEELVDYFTYKMKACESRYEYFLKKAKELGVKSIEIDKLDNGSSMKE